MSYILEYPESALVYVILLIICYWIAGLATRMKENNALVVLILIVVLTLFSGLRGYTLGYDTSLYIKNTLRLIQNGRFDSAYGEIGYKLIIKLAFILWDNYTSAFIALSVIIVTFFVLRFWELREVIDFRLTILTFYCMTYLSIFNTIRQLLAVSIIFWGTRYLYTSGKKNYIKYVVVVIIASCFHTSAFLGLALLAICELASYKRVIPINKLLVDLLLMICTIVGVIFILQIDRVQYLISFYLGTNEAYGGVMAYLKIGVVLMLELVGVIKFGFNSGRLMETQSEICDKWLLMKTSKLFYLMGLIIQVVGYHFSYLGRAGELFCMFELFYYCNKYDCQYVRRMKRVVIIVLSLYTLFSVLNSNGYGIMPYSNVFFD